MAIWDALSNMFTSEAFLPAAMVGGATLYGDYISSAANTEAARIAAEGRLAEARAIEEGNRQAQQRFNTVQEQAAPAQSYLRQQMVSDPSMLTPEQQQSLEDSRRDTGAALSASGLRGAGRAQVAALRQVEADQRAGFFDQNQRRADAAAQQLSGQYTTALTNAANLDASTGRAYGSAVSGAADASAGVRTANAGLRGQAIGDIASLIRSEYKDEKRRSRYDDLVAKRTGGGNDDNNETSFGA